MANQALFAGIIYDEDGKPVEAAHVGAESVYVVDDAGFKRHISSEEVDKEILHFFTKQIDGNEDLLATEAAKMTGKNDLFSMAIFKNQLQNINKEVDQALKQGFPAGVTDMLAMTGFKVTIDYHGNITNISVPQQPENGEGGGEE